MKKLVLVLACIATLIFQPAAASPQTQKPVDHGGKIDTKYDGFNYETVVRLQKMKVNCDGFKDKFKDACVSIEVSLHCPGKQLNYVRYVTLRVVFENQDWVHFHPPDQRNLSILAGAETLRLGKMTPVNTNTPGSWDTKVETLEATIPYPTFKKIAQSDSIEIQVGPSAVELREKNRAALKDLDNHVM